MFALDDLPFDFVIGGKNSAEEGQPTMIYNNNNGKVFWDADGSEGDREKNRADHKTPL